MANKGSLFLIPNVIAEGTPDSVIPNHVRESLTNIRVFLVENVRTARRFLSSLKIYESVEAIQFHVLDKDTPDGDIPGLMKGLLAGDHAGVITEAGCPGIADPGAKAVRYAHENGIRVIPLVGPSAILLALMASGLNGQHFAFHGYLPVDPKKASDVVKAFQHESKESGQTHIFIETPYRNNSVFKVLVTSLSPGTRLTVAIDLTGANEFIHTQSVRDWRSFKGVWPKEPAVFLFQA